MIKSFKKNFHNLMRDFFGDSMTKRGMRFDVFIMFLIFLSSLMFVLKTSITDSFILRVFSYIELLILVVFSIELIFRFVYAPSKKKFFFSIYSWIDILAVVPFWFGFQSQFIRMFRLFRIFRFLRFLNYSKFYVESHKFEDFDLEKLFFIRIIFTVFMFMFIAAAVIFQIEHAVNSSITTFWDAFYFVVISVTTVGYGDIVPVTNIAKLIIIFTILSALIIVPVYLTSLMKHLGIEKESKDKDCQNCGSGNHRKYAKYCYSCGQRL